MKHDVHCHLDLYQNPPEIAKETEARGIKTIAVTNLPSAYYQAKPHMSRFKLLKLALGLHPLLTDHHTPQERRLFLKALSETQFIGEVGLDFSEQGEDTKEKQIESFKFVLNNLQEKSYFVSIHSRGAEKAVLELITKYNVGPTVFHWYSGPRDVLEKIINAGHYFSINSSMVKNKKSMEMIRRIPREKVLTETDGPFIKLNNRPAYPSDVELVHGELSKVWFQPQTEVERQLETNFSRYFGELHL